MYEFGESFVACDQCGVARALWVVALPSGRTLMYCRHHVDGHRAALLEAGALIYQTKEV